MGFKDGIIKYQTEDSLMSYCNKNISQVEFIFYKNWELIFIDSATIATNFELINLTTTFANIMVYISQIMKWPYFMSFSCYWGGSEFFSEFSTGTFPSLIPVNWIIALVEGTEEGLNIFAKLTLWEHFLMNMIFNAGYIALDLKWLIEADST
jgi:hypothetical protein